MSLSITNNIKPEKNTQNTLPIWGMILIIIGCIILAIIGVLTMHFVLKLKRKNDTSEINKELRDEELKKLK